MIISILEMRKVASCDSESWSLGAVLAGLALGGALPAL